MKRLPFVLVLGIVAVGVFGGCSKNEHQLEGSVTQTATPLPATDADVAARERADMVASLRSRLGSPADSPEWRMQLESGSSVCALYARFGTMTDVLAEMRGTDILFDDIGMTEAEVMTRYTALGIQTAKSLLALYGQPMSVRNRTRCGEGGFWQHENGAAIMAEVAKILVAIGKGPESIGLTVDGMRATVKTDVQAYVKFGNGQIAADRWSESDGRPLITDVVREACERYGFDPVSDFGVKTDEY